MAGQADMLVVRLDVEVHHVGERILLGIHGPICDGARQVGDVDEDWEKAAAAEGGLMLGVVQRAQTQAVAISGRPDRANRIAKVADAVVPPADYAVTGGGGDLIGQRRVEGGEYGFP